MSLRARDFAIRLGGADDKPVPYNIGHFVISLNNWKGWQKKTG